MTNPLQTANFAHPPHHVGEMDIQPGMIVADFGAGSGHHALAIAQRLEHAGRLYAIDIQQDLLRRIKNESHKRGYANIEIIWSDLEHSHGSRIASGHVDRVLISNLLFQLENRDAVFVEALRILKPAGVLTVIDWNDSYDGLGPHEDHVVKKWTALAHATRNGFHSVRDFDAGAHHYGLIFKKPANI